MVWPWAVVGWVALAGPAPTTLPADPFAATEAAGAEAPARRKPAARARVRGRVFVYGARDAIAGARILAPDGRAVETDAEGAFALYLEPGRHRLTVKADGYVDLPVTVDLAPRQDLEMEYRLEAVDGGNVYRTVVKDKREVAVSSTTLDEREIHEVAGTQGDPLRVIQSLPGTSQLAGFLPYVVVRGAAPGNTGYYLDGTRVPALFHVALGPSVVHPYFIDAVDFYPSGAPVRLGRFASGIIEARTRPARRDRVHGELEVRITDAGGLLEIPFNRPKIPGCWPSKGVSCRKGPGKGSLTLAGRYSYTAGILTLVQSAARIQFWDYQARLDHRLGPNADYTAFAYGSFDDVGERFTTDEDTGEQVRGQSFLKYQFHRIDNRIRQRLRKGGQAQYVVVLGVDQTGVSDIQTSEWRVAPRIDVRFPVSDHVSLGMGIDQEIQVFRLSDDLSSFEDVGEVEDLSLIFSERVVSATGLYFDTWWKKGRFEVRPGIRFDAYAQVGPSPVVPNARNVTYALGFDPRLVLRQGVGERWTLKQSIGMYHQPPSAPIPIPGIESFGFELGLQRNIQGSVGYEVEAIKNRLHIVQDAYVGRLSNLQDYQLAEAADDDAVDEFEDIISQVSGWAWGLETMVKLDPRMKVFGWAAYTLSWSRRDFPVGGEGWSNWDQRHILNVVFGYKVNDKWNFGARVHYNTGRPWTAPAEGQLLTDALAQDRNNARLPPFFQLDLRVERNWTWKKWQLQVYLDVVNATYSREIYRCDAEDADSLQPFNGQLVRAQIVPRNGFSQCTPQGFRYVIPQLGVKARF